MDCEGLRGASISFVSHYALRLYYHIVRAPCVCTVCINAFVLCSTSPATNTSYYTYNVVLLSGGNLRLVLGKRFYYYFTTKIFACERFVWAPFA